MQIITCQQITSNKAHQIILIHTNKSHQIKQTQFQLALLIKTYTKIALKLIKKPDQNSIIFIGMYKNFLNGNNEKISKVIQLAVSYNNHRKSLERIKPAVGMPTVKVMQKTEQLTVNRIRYAQESRKFKKISVQRQNDSQSKRIGHAQSVYKRTRNPELINSSRIKSSQISQSKSKSRLDSRASLHSSDSQTSIRSNFMSRTRRHKEIENQNRKLAQRISNPKVNKSMRIKQLDVSYAKEQQYIRIRSRFSERSKSIMQSLMLDGLKMDKKNLQFLPQISSPRTIVTQTLINSPKSKHASKDSLSKTLLAGTDHQSSKKLKTLQFARNMGRSINKTQLIK